MKAIRRGVEIIVATLREIFDENAYQRFLLRRGLEASRGSYREFLEENRVCRERRAKCC